MKKINFQQLQKLLPGLKRNVLLKNHTTFRIGGPARYFFIAKTKKDLIKTIKIAEKYNLPFFILGAGSNILISDKGFKGIVVKTQLSNLEIKDSKIFAEAGIPLSLLVNKSIQRNLTGLEWAVGIPGTIGGAIYGNAGAFGKSMGDIVSKAEVYDLKTKKIKILENKNCKFKYRNSIFKKNKKLIITSLVLQLKKGGKKEIPKKFKEYFNYRKNTQPLSSPSAGSIFKNSPNFSAGALIEKAGLKGEKTGSAQISKKHANFIINLGGARAKDVKKLINLTKKKVKNKFGIILEEEIDFLGF